MSTDKTGRKLSRRGMLIGSLATIAATGTASAWALDRFVIDHAEVTNVSDLESSATPSGTASSAEPVITITTWISGEGDDLVTGYIADVVTGDATQIRTAFAEDTYGLNIIEEPSVIAERVGATLAINGDYYGFRSEGIVIRNGIAFRDVGARNGLALYADGQMKVYDETATSAQELLDNRVWQTWSFGPGLVIEGQIQEGIDDVEVDTNVGNHSIQGEQPRTGIGMIEPNHYLLVAVDGRSAGYSRGVTMSEFAQLFSSLGAQVAYNLDGGGSTAMIYHDELVNNPQGEGKERGTSDIIWTTGN
ncbi:phosphodiester glycosidase family protein [Propionimicrobium sp. PCR01-08-3]|uniref:phosphodiester glycosidase family protein n=1 Tax=Propionimicrobium sp. PCR01-08-3 TaxID=3052086 RepID=UPI00255CEDBC|nr:phosphodiester glycosidase family protein [Propionimicrobium sp. PCR01-08-3]WIY81747.1 phosphodiester glycosidase family protein [Propionimicrobium sp. PCR01-08-3]